MSTPAYAELHCHSSYSFQEGASSVEELLARAKELGYPALALTDHDNLCGAMPFAQAARSLGIQPITGAEVTIKGQDGGEGQDGGDNSHLTLLAQTKQGYTNLCRLITGAHASVDRKNPSLDPQLLLEHAAGLVLLTGCRRGQLPGLVAQGRTGAAEACLRRYLDWFGTANVFVELQQNLVQGDGWRNRRLAELAARLGVGVVATNNVHYHLPERHRLQDALVAIKRCKSLEETHRERRPNGQFYLKSAQEMAALFQECPQAVANTLGIAQRCAFDLTRDLGYRFPGYPVPPGHTPQSYLEELCRQAAERRYGGITQRVRARLEEEFRLVRRHDLAGFFLIYHEIIQLARQIMIELGLSDPEIPLEERPPGRGRGSSVAMLVGYLIGLSHIDPLEFNLSLDRFLTDDLGSVPDIDLDFPRNIREELILRVHRKWGWDRAALTGMISTYRMKGAVRDLGKALGLPLQDVDPRFGGGRGTAPLPNLVENNLNEGTILDGTDATNLFVFVDGTGAKVQSALNQAVDWNGDGDTGDGGPLTVNIDTSGLNGRPSACTNGGSGSTLGGHHDWDVIALNFRGFGDSADGAINPFTGPEPDLQELLELQEELNTTDLELAKIDSVDPAIAGTQLVYTLTITNHGPNPASQVRLTDVLPAGVSYVSDDAGCVQAPVGTLTCDLGQLLARASTQVSITVFIARDLVHNAGSPVTITNNATVANLAGPDADDSNNAASEATLIKAVADLDIASFSAVNPPGQMLVGQNVDLTLRKIITNHGPSAPMDVELTRTAAAPPDSAVTPSAPPPVMQPALGLDELRTVDEVFTISCSQPSPHTFTFTNEIQPFREYTDPALPDDADPNQANNHAQVVLQIECVVPVAINIHPGSFPNSVNPGKAGVISVAVLTTDAGEYGLPLAFNAQTIDPLSVRFDKANGLEGGYNAVEAHNQGHLEDSIEKLLDSQGRERTRDGDLDMVLHFKAGDTSIDGSTTKACVKGEWVDAGGGVHKFFGCDSVNAVPK